MDRRSDAVAASILDIRLTAENLRYDLLVFSNVQKECNALELQHICAIHAIGIPVLKK